MDGITDSMDLSLRKLREIVKDRQAWHAASVGLQRVGLNDNKHKSHSEFPKPSTYSAGNTPDKGDGGADLNMPTDSYPTRANVMYPYGLRL